MTSYVTPKKNSAFIMYAGLPSQANPAIFKDTPTLAAGDFKVSIDGAATANLGTLPTNTPGGKMVKFSLSAAEMNGDNITVVCSDAAGAEWADTLINIQTSARQVDDLAYPATSGRSMVVDASGLVDANMVKAGATGAGNTITTSGGVTLPAGTVASTTNVTAGTITTATNVTTVNGLAANVITAASIRRDTIAEIADGVWDEDATGHQTQGTFGQAIGDPVADTNTIYGAVVTDATAATVGLDVVALAASVAGIGTAGGAAINTDAATDNYAGGISGVTSGTTKVGTQTNTYTSTSAVNGVYHTMTHTADAIDIVYQFLIGGGTSPVGAVWTGYLTNGNDTITFSVWNHVGGAWEAMATQAGQVGTTNVVKNIPLYARHEGTSAAELGKVYIRLHCTGQSTPVLQTDQIYVSYSVTSRSVGYALGAVWLDTNTGVAGTESFVNGVADNPVLTLADALTIATANRLRKFEVGNGTTLTLASTTANKVFNGHEWTLELGGQNIASSMFIDASVSGTATGSAAEFETCDIGAVTLDPCFMHSCSFGSTFTIGSAGNYFFYNCHSSVAGTSTPVIDMGAIGDTNISLRRWSGGLTVNNIASGDVISIDAVSGGTITLNGDAGNVQVRGMVNVVDNRTGAKTLGTTNNMDARFDALDTAVADLPTNAELATALGTADDATLAAIAAEAVKTAAIKAKTDSLTFTVAGQVDANIKSVAGGTVNGVGSEADPWGP